MESIGTIGILHPCFCVKILRLKASGIVRGISHPSKEKHFVRTKSLIFLLACRTGDAIFSTAYVLMTNVQVLKLLPLFNVWFWPRPATSPSYRIVPCTIITWFWLFAVNRRPNFVSSTVLVPGTLEPVVSNIRYRYRYAAFLNIFITWTVIGRSLINYLMRPRLCSLFLPLFRWAKFLHISCFIVSISD
jgi:hypothetical protein